MTTVPEPLSADLMTMSLRLLSSLQARRSRALRLSRTGPGLMLRRSCSTAPKKVSSAGSLWGGGVQVPLGRNGLGLGWEGSSWKYSSSRIRRLNSIKSGQSALTSVQSTLRGVGQKERPLASNWVSSWLRVALLKLMTTLLSSWMLWLSRCQYLFLFVLRLWRRLRLDELRIGVEWLIMVLEWSAWLSGSWILLADVVTGDCGWLAVWRRLERLSRLVLLRRARSKARETNSPDEGSFLRCLNWSTLHSSVAESWIKCLICRNVEEEHVDLSWSKVWLSSEFISLECFWHSVLKSFIILRDVLVNNPFHCW